MKITSILSIGIVLSGLSAPGMTVAQPETMQIVPGSINHTAAVGVSGSFTLKKDAGGTWSTGTGGACLMADFSASLGDSRCVTKEDCSGFLERFLDALPDGTTATDAYAYCTRADGPPEPKRCWIRPGPQIEYCAISPTTPWPLNQAVQLPSAAGTGVPVSKLDDGKKVRWMVYTCLNGYDFRQPSAGKDRLGCKEGDADLSTSTGGNAKTLNP